MRGEGAPVPVQEPGAVRKKPQRPDRHVRLARLSVRTESHVPCENPWEAGFLGGSALARDWAREILYHQTGKQMEKQYDKGDYVRDIRPLSRGALPPAEKGESPGGLSDSGGDHGSLRQDQREAECSGFPGDPDREHQEDRLRG